MFYSGQRALIHPVSEPVALHGIAAGLGVPPAAPIQLGSLSYLEKSIFSHFTDNSQAALGPPLPSLLFACFAPCFPDQCHIWTQRYVAIQ